MGGELIEVADTANISSTQLIENIKEVGTTPNIRLSTLRRLLNAKPLITIMKSIMD